jgi:hypothetical protein
MSYRRTGRSITLELHQDDERVGMIIYPYGVNHGDCRLDDPSMWDELEDPDAPDLLGRLDFLNAELDAKIADVRGAGPSDRSDGSEPSAQQWEAVMQAEDSTGGAS